jgi:hypothetical protein
MPQQRGTNRGNEEHSEMDDQESWITPRLTKRQRADLLKQQRAAKRELRLRRAQEARKEQDTTAKTCLKPERPEHDGDKWDARVQQPNAEQLEDEEEVESKEEGELNDARKCNVTTTTEAGLTPARSSSTANCRLQDTLGDALVGQVYNAGEFSHQEEPPPFTEQEFREIAQLTTPVPLDKRDELWLEAVTRGHAARIRGMLATRCNDLSAYLRCYALFVACRCGHVEVVSVLVNTYAVSTDPYAIGTLETAHDLARVRGDARGACITEYLMCAIYGMLPVQRDHGHFKGIGTLATEAFGHDYTPSRMLALPAVAHPPLGDANAVPNHEITQSTVLGDGAAGTTSSQTPLSPLSRLKAWKEAHGIDSTCVG